MGSGEQSSEQCVRRDQGEYAECAQCVVFVGNKLGAWSLTKNDMPAGETSVEAAAERIARSDFHSNRCKQNLCLVDNIPSARRHASMNTTEPYKH